MNTLHEFQRKHFGNGTREDGGRYIDCLIRDDEEDDEEIDLSLGIIPKISIPEHEFEDIVNDLPVFHDLPITWLAWNEINKPTSFIIECFDIDEKIMIDTSGYEYPRYKAAIT
jgi:hypothetical protein